MHPYAVLAAKAINIMFQDWHNLVLEKSGQEAASRIGERQDPEIGRTGGASPRESQVEQFERDDKLDEDAERDIKTRLKDFHYVKHKFAVASRP